jgi:HSP20 family protein
MAEAATRLPIRTAPESRPAATTTAWPDWPYLPFGELRRQVDRFFDDFTSGYSLTPFGRRWLDVEPSRRAGPALVSFPAMEVAEHDKEYVITAELPGMDEKGIELSVANGVLSIKGEKQEEKEESKKDYYLSERRYGSFERSFQIPSGVDGGKIDASFQKGVLKVTLPKTEAAQQQQRKIEIKVK